MSSEDGRHRTETAADRSEMAQLIRSFDWARTPLGPRSSWPASLQSIVSLTINNPLPTIVLWGPELIQIYNDGWASIAGAKHPAALGQPNHICWPELKEYNHPIYERVLRRGESVLVQDKLIPLDRRGFGTLEEAYFTVSYAPCHDDAGRIGGIFVTVIETTQKVLAEREREQRSLEAAQRASDRRYRELFAAIEDGFCIVEMLFDERGQPRDYRIVEANPAFAEATGLRDAVGRTVLEMVPDIEHLWIETYGQVSLTGEPIRFENYVAAWDRWFDVYAFRFGQPDERKVAIFFKNVTQRKRSEVALREAELRFRHLADTAPAILWVTEADGSCSFLSSGWYQYTGQLEAQALGFGWLSATHPEDAGPSQDAFLKANERHEPFTLEYRIRRADGAYHWAIDAGRPRFDSNGRFLGYVGSVFDVDDLINAREGLREQRRAADELSERLRLALQSSKAGWFDWSAPTDLNVWSDELQRLYGFQPGEFGGRSEDWLASLVPEDQDAGREAIARSLQSGEFALEFRIRRHDTGEVRWMDGRGKVFFDDAGQALRMVGINVDITERKAAEAERDRLLASERAARAEAELASRLKDDFLATLSHELRTPLQAISGWAQLMRGGKLPDVDMRHAVEVINRNAAAQHQLIEDLLDMSRIISGKVRLDVQQVDLAGVVSAAVQSTLPTAQTKGVQLEQILDPLTGLVSGDPNRLQQVVWNLLTNAVKFTPKGGRVQVTLERVNSHLEITVSDTGIGIQPEFLPHVFDRFRQADAGTARRYGGLGLGLSIVKQLVEMHNGQVRAKSAGTGKGSAFIITLPLVPVSAEKPTQSHPKTELQPENDTTALPDLGGLLVLVVDDEPDSRDLIHRVLERAGARVITAGSAAEGLSTVLRERPGLIVSDIGMPVEDGYAFIQKVRALEGDLSKTPAVAVTAFARSEDRRRVVRAGFQSHIAKPMDASELIEIVGSLAKQQRSGS